MPHPAAIEIKQLIKNYRLTDRQQAIFDNLNLSINRGELIVLLGRSGSGKSTLLNLISGIDIPNQGTILINGLDITALSERQRTLYRRSHIGFVFQAYNLIPTLTVAENLLLPLELLNRLSPKEHLKAKELLASLALSEYADSYPDCLSGGEQQRVAIARALIHNPEIILADEPTGNLDLDTGQKVMQVLDDLVRKTGTTLLMATHSREVMGIADRVLTIQNRQLLELEKRDE